ncbi:MAG: DUF4982 domain-containing protein [Muribaculaceae bacterium]|nr:DUF4982 domain-containing protein [Muribaculaceae bacterium]
MTIRSLLCGALISASTVSINALTPDRTLLDSGWTVTDGKAKPADATLPHDWSIAHNFSETAPAGNDGAYLPTAALTYTRTLTLDTIMPCSYYLYLEGAYMNSEVSVNGEYADGHPYGYTSYRVDITPLLQQGDNTLEISVDNTAQKNSRWYTGTGLYRPVWLEHYGQAYIEPESMVFTSPGIRPGMAIGRIDANLIETATGRTAPATYVATLTVKSPDGDAEVHSNRFILGVNEHNYPIHIDFPIADPQLWSPDTPAVYEATLTVTDADGTVAEDVIEFGLRTIDFSAEEGFSLNGVPMTINGACVHHDNGLLGAASHSAAEWRKAALLKEAGFNAVRTAHNPPSPSFLRACDHLGLMVIDEAFDGWRQKKNDHDFGEIFDEYYADDLERMILRDRNHPSIIAWSIGNEILERKSPEAVELAADMAAICRSLDADRPVTQALASWDNDWEIYDPLAAQHDIIGYNYMIHKAEGDHERVPERVIWQTESYPRDAFSNYLAVRDHSYIIGDFVWTGIDYLGESGIGRHYYEGDVPGEHYERNLWPWHAAVCGDIDLLGLRKPISYYRQMLHTDEPALTLSVREPEGYRGEIRETLWGHYPTEFSWTWPGHEGKPIEVEVATTLPSVTLYLNDIPVETKKVDESTEYKAIFTLPYEPGTIRAEVTDSEKKTVAQKSLTTAGAPTAINLEAKRYPCDDADYDLIYLTASVVDADGTVNPTATNILTFASTPNGEILATGNADPKDLTGYHVRNRQPYQGYAQAIVKTRRNAAPTLTVSSVTLPTATLLVSPHSDLPKR